MRAVSTEKRLLLVSAKKRKESTGDIAKWLDISKHTIKLIWKVYKKTGSIEPKINQGRKSCMTEEHEACIREKIKTEPDATLQEIIDDLKLPIKKSQLHRWLSKNGYSYKKNSTCKQCPQRRCCYKKNKKETYTQRISLFVYLKINYFKTFYLLHSSARNALLSFLSAFCL